MKQHHPLLRRMLCAALALAVACMGTPALAKSIPALDPEMTVNSSHANYYGTEASLADGVYGSQENVDGGSSASVWTSTSNSPKTFTIPAVCTPPASVPSSTAGRKRWKTSRSPPLKTVRIIPRLPPSTILSLLPSKATATNGPARRAHM